MNLLLTRACSNSCPYCFEKAERQGGKPGFITMDNVRLFANWACNCRLEFLSLLGGEPFLHTQLAEIIRLLRQTCPGTGLRVLTGGVFNKHRLNDISPQDVAIGFNVNEPRDYENPKHFTKVLNNIETAILKGFVVTLSFNVWRSDFDTTFIPRLAHRFARSSFSWTVANPIRGQESSVVPTTQFHSLAGRCLAMLQESAKVGIGALLDCPLPLCFFKDADLGWIRQNHPDTAAHMGVCQPTLDTTPELEVIRCFACSKLARVKLTDFHNEREIREWFQEHQDYHLLQQGCFSNCNQCRHFIEGRCYGGCLARHQGPLNLGGYSKIEELAEKMRASLEAGTPQGALSLYEAAGYWWKTEVPTLIAAIAASRLERWDLAFRFAAEANDKTRDPGFMRKVEEFLKSIPYGENRPSADLPANDTVTPFISCPE